MHPVSPTYQNNSVPIGTQEKEEEIVRYIGITDDLKQDVQSAFRTCQDNLSRYVGLCESKVITSMADEMEIPDWRLDHLIKNNKPIKLKKIPEPDLKNMRLFFSNDCNLPAKIREKLTTLFPVGKEKLEVVEVTVTSSLVEEINTMVTECTTSTDTKPILNSITKHTVTSIAREMDFSWLSLDRLLRGKTAGLRNTQIESIREFARDHFENTENKFPALFSRKLLEIDNGTSFINSQASDSTPQHIERPVSNFVGEEKPSENAPGTNPNKRPSLVEKPLEKPSRPSKQQKVTPITPLPLQVPQTIDTIPQHSPRDPGTQPNTLQTTRQAKNPPLKQVPDQNIKVYFVPDPVKRISNALNTQPQAERQGASKDQPRSSEHQRVVIPPPPIPLAVATPSQVLSETDNSTETFPPDTGVDSSNPWDANEFINQFLAPENVGPDGFFLYHS